MIDPPSIGPTHDAAHHLFNYYGRWHAGRTAISINSGAIVEFAYRGGRIELLFDVAGMTHFPAIFVQVDNGPIARTTLSAEVATVHVTAAGRFHLVRFWIATHSLYETDARGRQWTTLVGGCRFTGADLAGGDLVPLPYQTRQIEFLGDSITQGLRLLYTGTEDDTGHQLPYANWPQHVADLLGMRPVVTGFGGQGLTTTGTSGAPPAREAFPLVHAGAHWEPRVEPGIVVIYQGSNDCVAPPDFADAYAALLSRVRGVYPVAALFAVCPHTRPAYAAAIREVAAARHDRRMMFLDYSTGVIAEPETCDGCHLNPSGAVALASRLATDIASCLSAPANAGLAMGD